jgi:uncharacterized protein (DUF433 family)
MAMDTSETRTSDSVSPKIVGVPVEHHESVGDYPGVTTSRTQSAESTGEPSGAVIVDRGRGPEVAGTRITIYRVMDFLKYNDSAPEIARELGLAEEQVLAALEYIRAHREESDREYAMIMDRVNQPNPPEVEQGRAKTREELRRRIRARLDGKGAHDHPVGQ